MKRRLLLLSNSTTPTGGFLGHAMDTIEEFLGSEVTEVLFIPYAAVTFSYGDYGEKVGAAFRQSGYNLTSIHNYSDPIRAVRRAEAIAVGGGNTFHLLHRLYEANIVEIIRERVEIGVPYIGWSAGANVACPTIQTTNDMPIIWPPSPDALGLISFQINPHYVDDNPPGFHGETRAQRISEFTYVNPNVYVIGLPEGGMIRIENGTVQLLGCDKAIVFFGGAEPTCCASLDFLAESVQ